jgi:hypothetical protein
VRLALAQHGERVRDLRARDVGRLRIDVGLVDEHEVDQFDDPALDRLQVVAGVGEREEDKAVGHARDRGFGLPDADRLDDHDVVARRLAQRKRLARLVRDAAEGATGRARPDERAGLAREPFHARLVAEDRPTGDRARRIDREHRDTMVAGGEEEPEGLDESGLAGARCAADADAEARAGVRQQRLEQRQRARLMVAPRRLDQRDRLCQSAGLAGEDALGELAVRRVEAIGRGMRPLEDRHQWGPVSGSPQDTLRTRPVPRLAADQTAPAATRARRIALSTVRAASEMTVPGPNTAATPDDSRKP